MTSEYDPVPVMALAGAATASAIRMASSALRTT
jgi:hypothetical protein